MKLEPRRLIKGRTPPPPKQRQPIVTVVFEGDSSWVCLYIDGAYFGDGEVDGFYMGELLEAAGCHVHYLNTLGLVNPWGEDMPPTLAEALDLPVFWSTGTGDDTYVQDPVRTLLSINEVDTVPTPTKAEIDAMAAVMAERYRQEVRDA
jgi:hypothetical protein